MSSGSDSRHVSQAYGQRGSNLQPGGIRNGLGTTPLIADSRWPRFAVRRDRLQEPRVYGCRGWSRTSSTVPCLDDAAGVHHGDVVDGLGDDAEVVGDQEQRGPGPVLDRLDELEDLALDGHVEGRRGLVGDDQLGVAAERHRDHDPLPHAARQLVRVLLQAPLGVGDADVLQRPAARSPRAPFLSTSWWSRTASMIWSPTVNTGLSEVIGSWKIIAIVAAADLADLVRRRA